VELLERDGALDVLADAYAAAAAGTGGRLVLVLGEPGIGKTALVQAFLERLDPSVRTLVGACDDLTIPRPLGPLRDVAADVSPALAAALTAHVAPHEVHTLLVDELGRSARPTVFVVEDVHWADGATIDALVVVGRRIRSLRALVLVTCRDGEVPEGVHGAVDVIRSGDLSFLELQPLSRSAVASLAGDAADDVYAATGGNPFFVTELLTSRANDALPPSVASAVLGRASRLGEDGRRLVELVSIVPSRMPTSMLDELLPGWPAAAEEAERRSLLQVEPTHVHFRHELARNAIASSIPAARRRGLHAEILELLLTGDGDAAEIVHHAEAAGAVEVVAEHALPAARRAAAVASNREAFSLYRRAVEFLDRLTEPEQAAVLEELAIVAYKLGDAPEALAAIERARALHVERGDALAVGRCTRVLARFRWLAGQGTLSREAALDAVAILEPLGESSELARAFSSLAQFAMLEEDAAATFAWAERAIALAERLGDESTRVHALVNVGAARILLDPDDTQPTAEAFAAAAAAGEHHEATRALGVAAYSELFWVQPERARAFVERGIAYAREYDEPMFISYTGLTRAWIALRAGAWAAAEDEIRHAPPTSGAVSDILALMVGTELAVRRGDGDAGVRLVELLDRAYTTAELQRIAPALELATVAAITANGPPPVDRFEALRGALEYRGENAGCASLRAAAWAAVAGVDLPVAREVPEPFASLLARDWRRAAAAFEAVGWTFDQAFFLSFLDDEEALVEAIGIAYTLGAAPLARHVARRMRALGLKVPRGPREATRANPLGLTPRQLQVLELVAAGRTNAEIAEALVVSTRTAEHHVAAVLTKLGATTRREAALRAAELSLETARR
jgi:DNA-binding CsgD family transcriptional regulator/tetratricopeptide (TPR) repeat protein